ncbi:MAG: hypothetical protein Kow0065_21100 [Methylomicrobium sp.]
MIPLALVGLLTAYHPSVNAQTDHPRISGSYGAKVGHKALNSFGNLGGAVLELPKNIINTTNQSNIFYGVTGGLFKGIVNFAGRIGVGVADLVTIPLPTKPIAYPLYVWDDFDVDTTYGDVYRLARSQPKPAPVARRPEQQPEPAPVAQPIVAPPAPVDDSDLYDTTTRKIDRLFQQEMRK